MSMWEMLYSRVVEDVLRNAPESYDGDDTDERTAIRYVRDLEDVIKSLEDVMKGDVIVGDIHSASGAYALVVNADAAATIVASLMMSTQSYLYRTNVPGLKDRAAQSIKAKTSLELCQPITHL